MKTEKVIYYNLTLSKSEGYNLVRVLIEYLNNFEHDNHERDTFTENNLSELLTVISDTNLIKESTKKLNNIKERCDNR